MLTLKVVVSRKRFVFSFDGDCGHLLGAFSFAIDRGLMHEPVVGIGWVEAFARLRNWMLKLPYGDQTLWMRRDDFVRMGGFQWVPILDDIEFVFRCRKIARKEGKTVYIDGHLAHCSPRRWQKHGVAWNTMWNQWLLFLYTKIKLTPDRIYKLYYDRTSTKE